MNRNSLFGLLALLTLAGPSFAYDVKRPAIRPTWSGAVPGEWTMDFVAATNEAVKAGKDVFVMTSGMWWCPHCQDLEATALLTPAWSNFVDEVGCYLVALDYPYRGTVSPSEQEKTANFDPRTQRPGWGFQCWLYDDGYRSEAGLTDADDVFKEIERRYMLQSDLGLSNAQLVTIGNWDDSGTITYRRVGYPTVIVLGPDGKCKGRVSAGKGTGLSVTNSIKQILAADAWDAADDFATGATELALPPCADDPVDQGLHTLSGVDKADWFKLQIDEANGNTWTFTVSPRPGWETTALAVSAYADPTKEAIASSLIAACEGSFSMVFPRAGTYYICITPNAGLSVAAGYGLKYEYSQTKVEAAFEKTEVSCANNAAEVELSVVLRGTPADFAVELDWRTVDGTASNGVDFVSEGGTVKWSAGETRAAKKISIPLIPPSVWQGDRTFAVELYPRSHCTIPERLSTCTVTLKESKTRNAGVLAFDSRWKSEVPVIREGAVFESEVFRTDGFDGTVTGMVALVLKRSSGTVTNCVWGHAEREAKAFAKVMPEEEGLQDDAEGEFLLTASGGAALGIPSSIRFILRDRLVEKTFEEYNRDVLGGAASYSGDAWFYGLKDAGSPASVLRSVVLNRGTELSVRFTGPSMVKFAVGCEKGAKVRLSLGSRELTDDLSVPRWVAIPSGTQTVRIAAEKGEEGSFVTASWEARSLSELKLVADFPLDKSSVIVDQVPDLEAGFADPVGPLPGDAGAVLTYETFAGVSYSALTLLPATNRVCCLTADGGYYPDAAQEDEEEAFAGLLSAALGRTAYWRMDVVFEDAFGNRAVRKGTQASFKVLPVGSPYVDVWGAGVQNLAVGAQVSADRFTVRNVPEGATVLATAKNGKLPKGVEVDVDEDGRIGLSGVPLSAGEGDCDIAVSIRKADGTIVEGATFRLAYAVLPLVSAAGTYDGYRIRTDGSAAQGLATFTVGKTGRISGKFNLGGTNFTFSARSFSAYRDGSYWLTGVSARHGDDLVGVSLQLTPGAETQDAILSAGGCTYRMYLNAWASVSARKPLAALVGSYAAGLPVHLRNPEAFAPKGNGWLTAKIKSTGSVTYSGVDALGKAFSGSSPVWHSFDCCTESGYLWTFYVCAKPSGSKEPGSGIFGLLAITPDERQPDVRYLECADTAAMTLVNLNPKSVYGYVCWTNVLDVVGSSLDEPAALPEGSDWTLVRPLEAFDDYDGRNGESGFILTERPAFLTLVARDATHAAFAPGAWSPAFSAWTRSTGVFSARFTLDYRSADTRAKSRRVSVKGVFVPHLPDGGSVWFGSYALPERATSETGDSYNVKTTFGVELR